MKPKAVVKIGVDALMSLSLMFLMGYQLWGDAAHEWAGAGMFLLFVLHHLLNTGWYRGLRRGRASPVRVLQLAIDILLFLAMIGLMVSGVMLSNHVFTFLDIHGGMSFARLSHMAASHWGFVLMALHLGLHWGMFMGLGKRALKLKRPSPAGRALLPALGALVAAYGLRVFIGRDIITYMLVRTQFVFLDFGEPIQLFYLDYLAMAWTFVLLAHYAVKLLRWLSQKQREVGAEPKGGDGARIRQRENDSIDK